ncbi:MAG: pilin [Minisyncoccota bacterium]
MKKILIVSMLLLFFGLAPHVFADGFTALAPITGLTDQSSTSVVNSATLASFFNNLYKYLIGVAAVLAVIEITWNGIEIAVNKEDVSKLMDSKGKIYNAIFGLVLVLSPALVFSIINPSILNLSLNLPPLKTAQYSGASGGGSGTSLQTPTVPQTGCSSSPSNTYLLTASCATQNDANTYTCPQGMDTNVYCGQKDQNGNCISGNTVYCQANLVVDYYKETHGITHTINPLSNGQVTPGYAQAQQTFSNSCSAAGGTMKTSLTKAGAAWLTLYTTSPLVPTGNGCNSADGTVPYNPQQASGVICYGENLSCVPPGT